MRLVKRVRDGWGWSKMKRASFFGLCGGVLFVMVSRANDAATETKRLQGNWLVTEAELVGKKLPDEKPSLHINCNHVQLGDIRMYYRTAGSGAPIVFLHGGFGSSDAWDDYFPRLADTYTVITPDSRGQGRTTIGKGP